MTLQNLMPPPNRGDERAARRAERERRSQRARASARERMAAMQAAAQSRIAGQTMQAGQQMSSVPETGQPRPPENVAPPAPPTSSFAPELDIGSWFGSGVAENVLGTLSPILQPLQTGARAGAGTAVNLAATITNPFGASPVPFFQEYQNLVQKHYDAAREEGLDIFRAQAVARERALEEKQFPKYVQGALELVFDPLNVVGFGAGKAATVATKKIIGAATKKIGLEEGVLSAKRLARVGPDVSEVENIEKRVSGLKRVTNLISHKKIVKGYNNPKLMNAIQIVADNKYTGAFSSVFKRINPGPLLAKTAVGQAMLVHMVRKASMQSQARAAVAEFKRHDLKKLFGLDENGFLPEAVVGVRPSGGKLTEYAAKRPASRHFLAAWEDYDLTHRFNAPLYNWSYAIRDEPLTGIGALPGIRGVAQRLARNPYADLNPKQLEKLRKEVIDEYQDLFEEGGRLARGNGVSLGEAELTSQLKSRYIGRYVREIEDFVEEDVKISLARGGRLATSPSSTKLRSYIGQEVEEAMKKGVVYVNDPVENVEIYLRGMYRAATDQQLILRLKHMAAGKGIEGLKLKNINAIPALRRVRAKAGEASSRARDMRGLYAQVRAISKHSDKRVHKSTMLKAARLDNVIFEKLEIANAMTSGADRAAGLRRIADDIKNIIKKEDGGRKELLRAVKAQLDTQRTIFLKKGQMIDPREMPHLKDLIFSPEDVGRIKESMGIGDPSAFLKVAESFAKFGDAFRVIRAGFDFGAPFLQGLPALANDIAKVPGGMMPVKFARPIRRTLISDEGVTDLGRVSPISFKRPKLVTPGTTWAKATAHHYRAFFDKGVHRNWLSKAENAGAAREMVEKGGVSLSGAASDYFIGLRDPDAYIPKLLGGVEKAGPVGRAAAKVARGTLGSFERSFDSFGDYVRVELWKGMRDTAAKQGDEGLSELGQFIRNSTGAFNSYSIGIPASQQAIERAFLFFSPRYTRASLALVGDIMSGGIAGSKARNAMVSMLSAGAGLHVLGATAMGQEPNLDPTKGDFLTLKVAGQNVGPGSFYVSFLRLFSKSVVKGIDDPSIFVDRTTRENPILAWWRGKSAPGGSLMWDYAMKADFLGNKLEHPTDWVSHIGKQTLPFALENAFFDNSSLSVFGTEVSGARTYPVSDVELRNDLREALASNKTQGKKKWKDLNAFQKKELVLKNTELDELTKAVQAGRVEKGGELESLTDEFYERVSDINEAWKTQIEAAIEYAQSPIIDENRMSMSLGRLRENIIKEANTVRRRAMQSLNEEERFQPVLEYFDEIKENGLNGIEAPEDIAYAEFLSIIFHPDLDYPDGSVNWEERDRRIADFRRRYKRSDGTEEIYGYVQARMKQGKDLDPLIQELYDQRERFRYYWEDLDEQVLASRPYDEDTMRALYKEYRRLDDLGKDELKKDNPAFNGFLKMRDKVRVSLRKQDPELDAFLYRWEYTSTLRAPENRGRERDLRTPQQGISLSRNLFDFDAEEDVG